MKLKMNVGHFAAVLVLPSLLLAGCATSKPSAEPGTAVTRLDQQVMPNPTRADLPLSTRVYALGAFDEIRIDVFGIEQMTGLTMQVDGGGQIAFPLVGTIDAAGKTTGDLAAEIETGLRQAHVRNPRVTVNLTEGVSNVFTVQGEVGEPGVYPIKGRTTLMSAVASARGTTEFSKLKDVVILRTVSGQSYAGLYDLGAIREGVYADPEIFAGDVVMVEESRGRRLFRDVLQAAPLLTSPLIIALQ
ncbi:polysaccharide biosynthesis/export family protein [Altericroceibacterium xinjiangense]|uniref:polysaccharide biosynthesis/export family protein n=1 Tax=Altericroceibacterium xinjiangense TaxID=762261 RepID=UPI001F493D87|nr:polysaccharide biosynthesis/export family protein [Altericroceibacterium xinjiangense]